MRNIIIFLIFFYCFLEANEVFYYKNGQKVPLKFIDEISSKTSNFRALENNSNNIKYYKTSNNILLGVRDDIIIKMKSGYLISDLLIKYNLKIIKQYTDKIYILTKLNSDDSTLDIANNLSLENSVESANPNFVKSVEKR